MNKNYLGEETEALLATLTQPRHIKTRIAGIYANKRCWQLQQTIANELQGEIAKRQAAHDADNN